MMKDKNKIIDDINRRTMTKAQEIVERCETEMEKSLSDWLEKQNDEKVE